MKTGALFVVSCFREAPARETRPGGLKRFGGQTAGSIPALMEKERKDIPVTENENQKNLNQPQPRTGDAEGAKKPRRPMPRRKTAAPQQGETAEKAARAPRTPRKTSAAKNTRTTGGEDAAQELSLIHI